MKHFVRKSTSIAACALAFLPVIALATVGHAEGVRIRVGDLTQTQAAVQYRRDVDRAANQLCRGDVRELQSASRIAACKTAVREEADLKALARRA